MDITQIVLYNSVITPIVAATAGSLAILGTLFWQKAAIAKAFNAIRPKLLTRQGFFWGSIFVFMAASVSQAGLFFSISGDPIGFGIALFLDLVTIVLMHAQLESRYRGEHGPANLFIFFIILTCGISSYANLAIAQNTVDAAKLLPNASTWVQDAAPYVMASFPLLVIMMSFAAEKIVNVRPLDKLKEGEFEAGEQKRVRILQIRSQYALEQAQLNVNSKLEKQQIKANQELREQQIKEQRQAQRNKSQRTFFLITWLFPRDPLSMQAVVTTVTEEVKKTYDTQFTTLAEQISNQIRQLGEQATQSTRQFQENIQSNLGVTSAKLASTNEQIVTLAQQFQSTEQIQTNIQTALGTMQTNYEAIITQQARASNLITELTQSTEQQQTNLNRQMAELRQDTERYQEHTLTTLTAKVSESIASELQSYDIPSETMITELIESAIQQYTECETDEHSMPIEGEKPLYPFYTAELKELVARFPMIDSWIRGGRRTISLQDVVAVTNFTSQFVSRQANDGMFTKTQTKNIYTTKSVINWLKTDPSPKRKTTKREEQNTEEINAIPQQDLQNTDEIPTVTEHQNGHNHSDKTTTDLKEYAELTV